MKRIFPLLFAFLLLAQSSFALTLGDTNGGASCDAGSTQVAATWTSTETDDFTAISINGSQDGANGYGFKGAIWADNGSGAPGSRLTSAGSEVALVNNGSSGCANNTYVTSNLTQTITAQALWIGGRETVKTGGDEMNVTFDTGVNGHERTITGSADPTDPFGVGTARAGRQYSIYATYTVTSGAARRMFVVM